MLQRKKLRQPVLVHGFTMIELIVVMTIIALLLTLAMPRYFLALERGKMQVQQQNIALLRDAIDKYYGDNARYPDQLTDLVTKRYLRSIPIDPITEAADWQVIQPPESDLGGVFDVQSAKPVSRDNKDQFFIPGSEVNGVSQPASQAIRP